MSCISRGALDSAAVELLSGVANLLLVACRLQLKVTQACAQWFQRIPGSLAPVLGGLHPGIVGQCRGDSLQTATGAAGLKLQLLQLIELQRRIHKCNARLPTDGRVYWCEGFAPGDGTLV